MNGVVRQGFCPVGVGWLVVNKHSLTVCIGDQSMTHFSGHLIP